MQASDLISTPADGSVPEELLPRLGDYLVEKGLISLAELHSALDYQKQQNSQENIERPILLGEALVELGLIKQRVLDQAIAAQFVTLHSALQKANVSLEQRIKLRTHDLERRLRQIRAAEEITRIAVSASTLVELFQRTVDLIADRFGFDLVAIYLVDLDQKYLNLAEASGRFASQLKEKDQRFLIGSRSMVGWSAANNQSRVVLDVTQDFFSNSEEKLVVVTPPGTIQSEAVIPITMQTGLFEPVPVSGPESTDRQTIAPKISGLSSPSNTLLGVLDVYVFTESSPASQSVQENGNQQIDPDTVAVLETITSHLSSVIQNLRLLEASCLSLNETNVLYRASQRLNKSSNEGEIFRSLYDALSDIEYPSLLLSAFVFPKGNLDSTAKSIPSQKDLGMIRGLSRAEAAPGLILRPYLPDEKILNTGPQTEPFLTIGMVDELIPQDEPFLLVDLTQPISYPAPILNLAKRLNCRSLALVPIRLRAHLQGMVALGLISNSLAAAYPLAGKLSFRSGGKESETQLRRDAAVQTCASICDLASSALDRIIASETNIKRLAALEALNRISQFGAGSMQLFDFYHAIHREVTRIIGEVDFLIAIYNSQTNYIQIPYMYEPGQEEGDIQQIAPFPLGAGMTSHLIQTREPLMILEDMEERARELGALTVGRPAKSWLGVPLIESDEVIGAMIVQDLDREHRFDEDDLRLMMILGSQVAIAIRTSNLIETTRNRAERQRLINEITTKLRNSNNQQTIIETAASEIRKALGAVRTRVNLGIEPSDTDAGPTSGDVSIT